MLANKKFSHHFVCVILAHNKTKQKYNKKNKTIHYLSKYQSIVHLLRVLAIHQNLRLLLFSLVCHCWFLVPQFFSQYPFLPILQIIKIPNKKNTHTRKQTSNNHSYPNQTQNKSKNRNKSKTKKKHIPSPNTTCFPSSH